jgi:hypothetical protein
MTLDEAYEYVDMAAQSESEQRAEYGMGAVSMGYDPYEWAPAYEGYRTSDDPQYAQAMEMIRAANPPQSAPVFAPDSADDSIPF